MTSIETVTVHLGRGMGSWQAIRAANSSFGAAWQVTKAPEGATIVEHHTLDLTGWGDGLMTLWMWREVPHESDGIVVSKGRNS